MLEHSLEQIVPNSAVWHSSFVVRQPHNSDYYNGHHRNVRIQKSVLAPPTLDYVCTLCVVCIIMAVASGPAAQVLVGPVLTVVFENAHAQSAAH